MAENSKIEWTTHTFNPWIGCTKVSQGCKHCYAETLMDGRFDRKAWGPQGTRQRTSETLWRKPLQWQKEAEKGTTEEERHPRVFCASLADVFECNDVLEPWRLELFDLIRRTPNLQWQLLTKRPESIRYHIGRAIMACPQVPKSRVQDFVKNGAANEQEELFDWLGRWQYGKPPSNVWLGASIEANEHCNRADALRDVPAKIRFLSIEPLIDSVEDLDLTGIHWVIVGGESGPGARAMHPDWARQVRDLCIKSKVPFFFKQWGQWQPLSNTDGIQSLPFGDWVLPNEDGNGWGFMNVGKGKAGKILDGREWQQFPKL